MAKTGTKAVNILGSISCNDKQLLVSSYFDNKITKNRFKISELFFFVQYISIFHSTFSVDSNVYKNIKQQFIDISADIFSSLAVGHICIIIGKIYITVTTYVAYSNSSEIIMRQTKIRNLLFLKKIRANNIKSFKVYQVSSEGQI